MPEQLNLGREIQRKLIHISTIILPLAYLMGMPKQITLYISFTLAAGFLVADVLRMNFTLARRYFMRVFSVLLREQEKESRLTGATWLFTGMALCFYLFPLPSAVCGAIFVCLADPAAAIIGRRYGRVKLFKKTLEGSLGFFITAAVVVLMVTDTGLSGLAVAFVATVLELLPIEINDNLSIPLVSGYLLTLLG